MNSTMNTFSQTNSPNRITPGRSEAAMPVKRIIFNWNHLNSYSKSSYSKKRIINRYENLILIAIINAYLIGNF